MRGDTFHSTLQHWGFVRCIFLFGVAKVLCWLPWQFIPGQTHLNYPKDNMLNTQCCCPFPHISAALGRFFNIHKMLCLLVYGGIVPESSKFLESWSPGDSVCIGGGSKSRLHGHVCWLSPREIMQRKPPQTFRIFCLYFLNPEKWIPGNKDSWKCWWMTFLCVRYKEKLSA